ncbi:uncharacterized protein G6M90_00g055060 [Metarhizium brunneum]|uniref:Uncharacterized protein n=1 Tax=Metarhizium brunneum TaxID=500148 RepID=A0A7D5YUM0_9HYPO|nr:hypothetical protein G6M90_00g055060 [Metarhizium brunneum]
MTVANASTPKRRYAPIYNMFVLWLANLLLWTCPPLTPLLPLFTSALGTHHVHIGVETAYFASKAPFGLGPRPRQTSRSPGDAVSLCEGVLELTFPVALAAFLFDVATIIVNRLGIPGASTMPLVVSIACHLVLTFTCLICFAGLFYIFTRSVNFSWPVAILFIVLVSSLGVLSCAAFVYGVISWR